MDLFAAAFGFSLVVATIGGYVSYDQLYEYGLNEYGKENWNLSISSFEEAISSYKHCRTGVLSCYHKCKNTSSEIPLVNQSNLGKITLKAVCTRECLDEEFGDHRLISGISPEVKRSFEKLAPYQYLQYAYFKEGLLAKSVSSAYTFNLRYPEDEMMKGNMEYFRGSSEVTDDMFVNMEPRLHLENYDAAVQAYLSEDYEKATKVFEVSLQEYYKSVEECHALCENENTHEEETEWENLDFYRQIAYHYVKVLECNLKCVRDLATDVGEKTFPNFLPVQYHYLQFAYYQLNNTEGAAECAKSYLVFHSNDTVMLKNLRLFSDDIADMNAIQARQDAVLHYKKTNLEVALLEYSYQNFGIQDYDLSLLKPFEESKAEDTEKQIEAVLTDDENVGKENLDQVSTPPTDAPYESMKEKTDDIISKKDVSVELKIAEAEKKERDELHYMELEGDVDISDIDLSPRGHQIVNSKYMITVADKTDEDPLPEGPIIYKGTVLLANSSQLKGRERFAVDGLATDKECLELIDLELSFGKPGDGYQGKSSPHTKHETFEGVTLLRTANLAKQGLLPLSTALLYYELSEKARAQVQAYFKLPHLYFDYTHLVCRTTNPDSPSNREDLSHPVHADNCLLRKTGECVKERPAYTWRDYSAILYLNEGFLGGEFLFADSTARRVRTLIKPKCGRMVSFSAGPESFHGVKPVINGRRCAVALWFTLSEEKNEQQRIEARNILAEIVMKQKDEL